MPIISTHKKLVAAESYFPKIATKSKTNSIHLTIITHCRN